MIRPHALTHTLLWLLAGAAGCTTADTGSTDPFDDRDDIPPLASGKADDYAVRGTTCAGWPRVSIDTADFVCAGLVASDDERLFKPRALIELPGRPLEFLVTDLGGWRPGQGKLWYLDARRPPARLVTTDGGLSLPHHIQLGPDGRLYLGEDTRITAFPPSAIDAEGRLDAAQIRPVITGLPPMDRDGERNSFHPLSQFVFDDAGHLFVNVGAFSDHCERFAGAECRETDGNRAHPEGSADRSKWGAVIRRYARVGDDRWSPDYTVVAYGLRNSMGLLFAANGDLLQVENSRDFPDSGRPFEELNVIPKAELDGAAPAHHYGWPYCYDVYETSEEWADYDGFKCARDNPDYRPPHILLPPHGAPLGLTYYRGSVFEELAGQLIVPLHGYRAPGQRVLAFPVDPNGLPIRAEGATWLENPVGAGGSVERSYPDDDGLFAGRATYLIDGWFEVAGLRPKGAPVAPYVATDGTIWIADDKNRSILVLARADSALPPVAQVDLYPTYQRRLDEDEALRAQYEAMVDQVLRAPQCAGCHDNYKLVGDDSRYPELRYLLALGNWITPGRPEDSILYTKLVPIGGADMPPSGREWASVEAGEAALGTLRDFILALPDLQPAFNEGWIGGPCATDADCDFDGGRCAEVRGRVRACTLPCTLERPYCPDRAGNASTFCVDLDDGTPGCVAQCDLDAPACGEGQTCVLRGRFGHPETSRGVCR